MQSGHRLSSNARYSSYYYEATAGRFDRRLSLWGELFCVSIGICDIDFSDEINGRFRLSVKSLNSRTTRAAPAIIDNATVYRVFILPSHLPPNTSVQGVKSYFARVTRKEKRLRCAAIAFSYSRNL